MSNYFDELAKVNCSEYTEKKGKFTYLSWPFAMAELAKRHPKAEIEVREWDGFPAIRGPKGWMVRVDVSIDGVKRTQWHPVLDSNNRAIPEPDVFQLNTSIQRATVKAIALHGLGLYIYAGEDLPEGAEPQKSAEVRELTVKVSPSDGVWDALDADTQIGLQKIAAAVGDFLSIGDAAGAFDYIQDQKLGTDEKAGLNTLLESGPRRALKGEYDLRKKNAASAAKEAA